LMQPSGDLGCGCAPDSVPYIRKQHWSGLPPASAECVHTNLTTWVEGARDRGDLYTYLSQWVLIKHLGPGSADVVTLGVIMGASIGVALLASVAVLGLVYLCDASRRSYTPLP
jgi:hypothetical protein